MEKVKKQRGRPALFKKQYRVTIPMELKTWREVQRKARLRGISASALLRELAERAAKE